MTYHFLAIGVSVYEECWKEVDDVRIGLQAALMWSKKYCDSSNQTSNCNNTVSLNQTIGSFLEFIHFHKIPANVLMKDIHPLGYVPYSIIMNALAYQVCRNIRKTS